MSEQNQDQNEDQIIDIGKMSDLEAFDFLTEQLGYSENQARFMIAIKNGSIPGDVIIQGKDEIK